MKTLRYMIMTFALIAGLSAVSFGQKDDKKPPPKGTPPVINPQPKNPPPQKTPEPGRKKPNEAVAYWKKDTLDAI